MDVKTWLDGIAVGAIFSIFPVWWYSTAMVINAASFKGKVIPKWLYNLARNAPGPGLFAADMWGKRYYQTILKIMTFIWMIGFIIFFQTYSFINYFKYDSSYWMYATDFGVIPFLLVSYGVSIYFFEQIPATRKTKNNMEPKRAVGRWVNE